MPANPQPRLPKDADGYPIQAGASTTQGSVTLGVGTGTDNITIPAHALTVTLWSSVVWGFKGIGTEGTEVPIRADHDLVLPCVGGGTIYVDQNSGGAGTLYYIFTLGDKP